MNSLITRLTLLFACLLLTGHYAGPVYAQSLLDELSDSNAIPKRSPVTALFKTTRVVNGHSAEMIAARHLDFRINHRFGRLNEGSYTVYGLDYATMRMALEYGITDALNIGLGRSSIQKEFDVYLKGRLLRQETGDDARSPVSIIYVATGLLSTQKLRGDSLPPFESRSALVQQLLIARKLNPWLSLQLSPTAVYRGKGSNAGQQFTPSLGIGGRLKLSKRLTLNAEYFANLGRDADAETYNSLSLGFDIETGGHVFQLNISNSLGLNERRFIAETDGQWSKGDLHFGFCISRIFSFDRRHLNKQ